MKCFPAEAHLQANKWLMRFLSHDKGQLRWEKKEKKSFLTDDLVSLFSHDISRKLGAPSSDGQSKKKKRKLTKSDNEKQTMPMA